MKSICLILLIVCFSDSSLGATHKPKSDSELTSILKSAKAGDTIELGNQNYKGHFVATQSGTSDKPITLTGSKGSVLSGGSNYGLHLDGANYWILKGFTVTKSSKGVMLDNSNHNVIDGVTVRDINAEGIHLRKHSSDNTVKNCNIHDTGKSTPGFGEGLYIGSSVNNWGKLTGGKPDKSMRNKIINNVFGPNVAAEHIDIKEATCCGLIQGNTFNGHGMTGEHFGDSWMDIKGESYTIENNKGDYSIGHGFEVKKSV